MGRQILLLVLTVHRFHQSMLMFQTDFLILGLVQDKSTGTECACEACLHIVWCGAMVRGMALNWQRFGSAS